MALDEGPDADPHVRWCERGWLAAAPYSMAALTTRTADTGAKGSSSKWTPRLAAGESTFGMIASRAGRFSREQYRVTNLSGSATPASYRVHLLGRF